MRWRIAITTLVLAIWAVVMNDIAHQGSFKERLVGAWTLVSWETITTDGNDFAPLTGDGPKGQLVIAMSGDFGYAVIGRPSGAALDRMQTGDRKDDAIAQALSLFGSYTVSDADQSITLHIDRSSRADLNGTAQKLIVTSVTTDEMRSTSAAISSGPMNRAIWKRVRF
jgi:hypothetical protein